MSRLWRISTGIMLCITLLALSAFGDDEFKRPLWSHSVNDEIVLLKIIDSNMVLISTLKQLKAIDITSGTPIWETNDLNCCGSENLGLIPGTPLAVVHKQKIEITELLYGNTRKKILHCLVVINIINGRELWNSNDLGYYSCLGCYYVPSQNAILFFINNEEDIIWMVLCDIYTGTVLWENKSCFNQNDPNLFEREMEVGLDYETFWGNQFPIFDTDTTMITYFNKTAIRKWNIFNGDLIWATLLDTKNAPALTDGYPQSIIDVAAEIVYTPVKKTLYAISTNGGNILWETKLDCPGHIHQMTHINDNILVRCGNPKKDDNGSQYLFLLNAETGDVIWGQKKLKLKSQWTSNFIINDSEAVIYTKDKLYGVAIADGSYREIAKDLKLKEKVSYFNLSMRNNNYLLISMQNILAIDKAGTLLYQNHTTPPKASILSHLVTFVASMAMSYAMRVEFSLGGTNYYVAPMVYYKTPQYGSSRITRNYMYMLGQVIPPYAKTKAQIRDLKRTGVAKINKNTGEIEDQIMLDKKDPIYDVDEDNSVIIFLKESNEIVCYEL